MKFSNYFLYSDINCLKSLSVSDVLTAQGKTWEFPYDPSNALTSLPWEPVIDGNIIVGQPLELYQAGKFYQVPAIFGNVRNETFTFVENVIQFLGIKNLTKLEYEVEKKIRKIPENFLIFVFFEGCDRCFL